MNWQKLKNQPEFWQIFRQRAEIIEKIRRFFFREGFLEVQTPLLAPALIPESYLEVFETKMIKNQPEKALQAFLTPSPELWHKKLLAAGAHKIFEITKAFRNTDSGSSLHNPEFTILEWYRKKASYRTTMKDCENLIRFIVNKSKLTYQNKTIRLDQPFERISLTEVFKKYTGKNIGPDFNLIYVREIEPHLGQEKPTIIYDYPAEFAPLAKTSAKNPKLKERFELYLFGIEIADAYSELTEAKEQKQQFEKEIQERKKLNKINHLIDWEFIKALRAGLPPCSGVALGIDRLVMILTNQTSIHEVILFSGEDIFPN